MNGGGAAPAAAVEGTVVFTDIVGFTQFTAERGDERALALLDTHTALVSAALPDTGRLVKELGDGALVHVADPVEALPFCVRLRRDAEGAAVDGFPLWLRMGAHHGAARRRGDDLIGHAVNAAARIASLAQPREILVSDAAVRAAGVAPPGCALEEIGPTFLRGVPEPVWLYRLTTPR